MEFVLFEDNYPDFSEDLILEAMTQMDEGYLAQDYYRGNKSMIPLSIEREETFTLEDYSWTEHICRKWGQAFLGHNLLAQFKKCGFNIEERAKQTNSETE